jgi:hypothetical protein
LNNIVGEFCYFFAREKNKKEKKKLTKQTAITSTTTAAATCMHTIKKEKISQNRETKKY